MKILIHPYRQATMQSTINLKELMKKQREEDKKNSEHIKNLNKEDIRYYFFWTIAMLWFMCVLILFILAVRSP
jgi:hypothetical protein